MDNPVAAATKDVILAAVFTDVVLGALLLLLGGSLVEVSSPASGVLLAPVDDESCTCSQDDWIKAILNYWIPDNANVSK